MSTADALWQWDDLVRASGGTWTVQPSMPVTGISIDTRSLQSGDLFAAVQGENSDGHAYVAKALMAGAAGAIVRPDFDLPDIPEAALLRVPYSHEPDAEGAVTSDPVLRALRGIARAARARLSPEARIIAVTGSAGKTGTKEMLRAALSRLGATHAPEKSFNNHWGVPLTLARMPAGIRFGVFEIGMNHAGEITPLTKLVRPHVAIVTNVLPVHVGNFPDGEAGVAKAKAEIFEGLEAPGTMELSPVAGRRLVASFGADEGFAVINRDGPHFDSLAARASKHGAMVVTFGGAAESDMRLDRAEADAGRDATRISARFTRDGRTIDYTLGMVGQHLAMNSLAVVAALDVLDGDLGTALAGLAEVHPPTGRGERHVLTTGSGVLLLIDEAYNANPASMATALTNLTDVSDTRFVRRIAVMGDMLELGEAAGAYHKGLQSHAERADLVFACGPNMKLLFDGLTPVRRGRWTPTSEEIIEHVLAALQPGDVVMVKGSLGSRMAPIVAAIKQHFAATG